MNRSILALLLLTSVTAFAQTSPAKQALVDKMLLLQRPGIEQMGQALAEQPALQLRQQAGNAIQTRVAPEKRDAVSKAVQADLKKYADDVVPLMRQQAVKLAPGTVGVILAEKFSEDELKQIIGMLESPVYRKYQQLSGEMQKALVDKLVADMRATVEPKAKALAVSLEKHLDLPKPAVKAPAGNASASR